MSDEGILIHSKSRRLSADRIITRILESAAREPKYRFQILNDAMVSRATLTRYISYLRDEGLLEEVTEDGKLLLHTTSQGVEYLKGRKSVPTLPQSTISNGRSHAQKRASSSPAEEREDGVGASDNNGAKKVAHAE